MQATASQILTKIDQARQDGADWESVIKPLYADHSAAIKREREAYQDQHYTTPITCPEHPNAKHQATLYQHGHRYAGIWECPKSGASDSCEHESTHVEEAVEDHLGFQGHYQTEHAIYVCDACECTVDGDPVADAAEDAADRAYDEWRDNQL